MVKLVVRETKGKKNKLSTRNLEYSGIVGISILISYRRSLWYSLRELE